jgi:hypothetical protein
MYNASALNIYNTTCILLQFVNKNIFFCFDYYNAGVVVVNFKVVGLGPRKHVAAAVGYA